jgi:MFS family permease
LPAMIIYLFLLGAGTGLAWEVLIVVIQEAAPADQLGSATAVNGFCREVGVLVGTAAVGGLLVNRLARRPVIGPPPAIRHRHTDQVRWRRRRWRLAGLGFAALAGLLRLIGARAGGQR